MINKYSPVIQSKLDLLIARLRALKEEHKVVSINLAYGCYANDVVSQYAFSTSYNFIENADEFHTKIHDAIDDMTACVHFFRMAPWLVKPMQNLPEWVIKILGAKTIAFYNWGKVIISPFPSGALLAAILNHKELTKDLGHREYCPRSNDDAEPR
jgi:hypothetical protein